MTTITWIAVLLVFATSTGLLISRDWRVELSMLGLQYVGAFWLTQQHWPISMAAIKLITGWMTIATLGMTRLNMNVTNEISEKVWPQGQLFRVFTVGIITLIVITTGPQIENIIPGIGLQVIAGGLVLLCLGLLHLGLTVQPFRVILGLLTILSGFEIIYAALESSILVAAMLSVVNLGLALVGSYLLTAIKQKENV